MGAADILRSIADAGLTVEVEGSKLVIRPGSRLTDDLRAAIKSAGPELLAMLTLEPPRPFALSGEDGDRAHQTPWTEAEIAKCVGRITLFMRRGLSATDADDLAERLHLRDLDRATDLDDRSMCIECAHYRSGRANDCANEIAAGPRLRASHMATVLQRCPGFDTALPPNDEVDVDRDLGG